VDRHSSSEGGPVLHSGERISPLERTKEDAVSPLLL